MPKVLGVPEINIGRSTFPREYRHMTTFNNGDIIPLLVQDVTPGDSTQLPIKALIRMQTPLYPVMDNMFFDVAAFFVPHRLVWEHFKEFWGENNTTYWEQPTDYEIPQIEPPEGGWKIGSLADKFGLPTGVDGYSVSHLPFRAYAEVWNSYYRDENLKQPIFYNKDETTLTGKNNINPDDDDYITDVQLGAFCAKAAKVSDYFTKCLPEPQKNSDPVTIPLQLPTTGLPVKTKSEHVYSSTEKPLYRMTMQGVSGTGTILENFETPLMLRNQNGNNIHQGNAGKFGIMTPTTGDINTDPSGVTNLAPLNLWAETNQVIGPTVNALRMCVAMQRYYERLAESGSRYIEVLAGMFGVKSSDARLQRPEFIGGHRYKVNMTQVLANTEGTNQKIGSTGGMSQTIINDYLGTKSFEEHGTLLILGVARCEHTYQNGIDKFWLRKKQFDFYTRALDHIGEQPVLNSEIYVSGNSTTDNGVFGYQPAFEDMRLGRKFVTGEFRSHATASLDAWHYADDYSDTPTLGNAWIDEPVENVDRTLSIQSSISNQMFGDFVFETIWTRGMSMYGTPGFMDHM